MVEIIEQVAMESNMGYEYSAYAEEEAGYQEYKAMEEQRQFMQGDEQQQEQEIDNGMLYCCNCKKEVKAQLVKGDVVYPHREDLYKKSFYKCECGGFVGCHPRSTKPLGCIPSKEIKNARKMIHGILDPMWKNRKKFEYREGDRKTIYKNISEKLGYEYHTGEIKDIEEARKIYRIVQELQRDW